MVLFTVLYLTPEHLPVIPALRYRGVMAGNCTTLRPLPDYFPRFFRVERGMFYPGRAI